MHALKYALSRPMQSIARTSARRQHGHRSGEAGSVIGALFSPPSGSSDVRRGMVMGADRLQRAHDFGISYRFAWT
jgi:hypothetical protein